MSVLETLDYWIRVRSGLVATIEKFAHEELDFRPFEKAYSVGETILHIAHEEEIEVLFGLARLRPALPPAPPLLKSATTASLEEALASIHWETETYLRSLPDAGLQEETELAWGGRQRRIDVVLHVLEHEIHHRGELSLMLGLLGRRGLDA
jgi:uncharacterized damage-inducible protein DinB